MKYAIKDLILTLGERKPILNAKYYFHRKKMMLKVKYSLKLEAEIVSCTNALVKYEAKHMPDNFENERSNLKL